MLTINNLSDESFQSVLRRLMYRKTEVDYGTLTLKYIKHDISELGSYDDSYREGYMIIKAEKDFYKLICESSSYEDYNFTDLCKVKPQETTVIEWVEE